MATLPTLILVMLLGVALLSGLLAGHALAKRKRRDWMLSLIYAAVVTITVYAVLDMDSPRTGLIRLDAADRALAELAESIR